MTARYLIEEPSPFAPREEWERFLADMTALDQDSPEVIAAIAQAKEHLGGAAAWPPSGHTPTTPQDASGADPVGWMPKIGEAVRLQHEYLHHAEQGRAQPEKRMVCIETLVTGREFAPSAPPKLHVECGGALTWTGKGWTALMAGLRVNTPMKVWGVDGVPVPPSASFGPAPARRHGLPFPGDRVTLTLSDGRIFETVIAGTDGAAFRVAVFPNERIEADGSIRDTDLRVVQLLDAIGSTLPFAGQAANEDPGAFGPGRR